MTRRSRTNTRFPQYSALDSVTAFANLFDAPTDLSEAPTHSTGSAASAFLCRIEGANYEL